MEEPAATASSPSLASPEESEKTRPSVAETPLRRMPEDVRKHLIRLREGQHYLPVAARVLWFRDEHPDWSLTTEIAEGGYEAGWATVKATVRNAEGRIISTGMKTESKQDFPAGWVEKAETGAIGRALAMAGYGTQFAPELDDTGTLPREGRPAPSRTSRASLGKQSSVAAAEVWRGPGLCPGCNAPEGRPHTRHCSIGAKKPG